MPFWQMTASQPVRVFSINEVRILSLPDNARERLRETLQRLINEGSGGLICILL